MMLQSKHIAIKYHWFWSHLKNRQVVVKHVGTQEQLANILTKALDKIKFKEARVKVMGW